MLKKNLEQQENCLKDEKENQIKSFKKIENLLEKKNKIISHKDK